MNINLPSKVRSVIYLINLFGTPAVGALVQANILPAWVGFLWGVEVAAAMGLARLNVTLDEK